MNTFIRILKYTKSYRLLMAGAVLSSTIFVLLNCMSIWLIGAMLGNIMGGDSISITQPSSLNEYLNYSVQNLIGRGTQIEQLKMLCILLTLIFIFKNILFYISNLIMSYVQNNVITNISEKRVEDVYSYVDVITAKEDMLDRVEEIISEKTTGSCINRIDLVK